MLNIMCNRVHEKDIRIPMFTLAVKTKYFIRLATSYDIICHHESNSNLSMGRCSISVVAEMLHLLLLHLLFHICVSAKQTRLEDTVKDDLEEEMYKSENNVNEREEELMQRMERMEISWKTEKADLENKLEEKNVEVEKLQQQLRGMKV